MRASESPLVSLRVGRGLGRAGALGYPFGRRNAPAQNLARALTRPRARSPSGHEAPEPCVSPRAVHAPPMVCALAWRLGRAGSLACRSRSGGSDAGRSNLLPNTATESFHFKKPRPTAARSVGARSRFLTTQAAVPSQLESWPYQRQSDFRRANSAKRAVSESYRRRALCSGCAIRPSLFTSYFPTAIATSKFLH